MEEVCACECFLKFIFVPGDYWNTSAITEAEMEGVRERRRPTLLALTQQRGRGEQRGEETERGRAGEGRRGRGRI